MSEPAKGAAPSRRCVRVPASTSNLGPGFDQLGLALELYLEVEMRGPIEGPSHALGACTGTAEVWPREDNLLLLAFDACLRKAGAPLRRFEFRAHSDIPQSRGLGSSGAAVVAGLVLANEWLGDARLSPGELAGLGCELEGHPDNSTASLFGGCTLGVPLESGALRVVQHPVHADLLFAVAWNSFELSTARAREAMPASLELRDVVWNLRRLSLLLRGLSDGDAELLRLGGEDRLHTPYRLPLIPGATAALAAAERSGAWLAAISGSGSALIAVHDDARIAREIGAAMAKELAVVAGAQSLVLRAAREGAQLVPCGREGVSS